MNSIPISSVSSCIGTTLLQKLQSQLKERWGVLLDALFSDYRSNRLALLNPFLPHKGKLEQVQLHFRCCILQGPPLSKPDAPPRDCESNLLKFYWCFPSSILPILLVAPNTACRVLIIGQPSCGRLLAVAQLIFGKAISDNRFSEQDLGGNVSQTMIQTRLHPTDRPDWQKGLPWSIYGEGVMPESPTGHHFLKDPASVQDLQLESGDERNTAVPQQPWTTLGIFVEGLLHRSIKAGCCTVRTASGDWAEMAEKAMQQQLADQAAQNHTPPAHRNGEAHCVELSEIAMEGAGQQEFASSCPEAAVLDCLLPNGKAKQNLELLLHHHLPADVRRQIRLREPGHAETWWQGSGNGTRDLVIVEAPCSATKAAVMAACQSNRRESWPQEADEKLFEQQRQLALEGFSVLKKGGCLLYCCASLAREETEDVVQFLLTASRGAAKTVTDSPSCDPQERESVQVSLKRFSAEKSDLGWRLLPDLAFQGPLYFSLIQKTA